MDDLLKEITELSDGQLRQKLIEHGESIGPILHSLRKIYEKKLAKLILRSQGIDPDEECNEVTNSSSASSAGEDGRWLPAVHKSVVASLSSPTPALAPALPVSSPRSSDTKPDQISSSIESTVASGSSSSIDGDTIFLGISLPGMAGSCLSVSGEELVFQDKVKALKAMKELKGSRFKVFKSREDALAFTRIPAEEICPSPKRLPNPDMGPSATQKEIKAALADEKCPYKEPTRAERINLMKHIERGEYEEVKRLIWSNPRFVISNGDTPVILHEAFRYNALHIAAKFNQSEICRLYINTIEDLAFLKLMFPSDTEETTISRINFLLDLYLNMPEKGVSDSALHSASKFGALETVKILAAHPQTDINLRNKYNETPADVCGRRDRNITPEVKAQIVEILSSSVYVPLLRTEDNTEQPFVGEPWSSEQGQKVKDPVRHCQPVSRGPQDPRLKVKAYAGPMSPTQADQFYKKWHSCPTHSPDHMKRKYHELRRGDMEKGLERLGRELASDLQVPWTEHWDFLNEFTNLSMPSGLKVLEDYLQKLAEKRNHLFMIGDYNVNNNGTEKLNLEDGIAELHVNPDKNNEKNAESNSTEQNNENNSKVETFTCKELDDSTNYSLDDSDTGIINANSSRSSLNSLIERMGRLNIDDTFNNSVDSKIGVTSFNSTFAEEDESPDSDEEFFESSAVISEVNSADSQDKEKNSDVEAKKSNWRFVGYLKNVLTGLRLMTPKSKLTRGKGTKMLEHNIPDLSPDEEEIFLDAEDSMIGEVEPFVEGTDLGVCSTPKSGLSKSMLFGVLQPGKLQRIFIEGDQPTKLDLDVLRAIEHVDLDPHLYPYTLRWKETVTRFSINEQSRWPSPAAVRRRTRHLTPQTVSSRPVFQTTPKTSHSAEDIVSRLQF